MAKTNQGTWMGSAAQNTAPAKVGSENVSKALTEKISLVLYITILLIFLIRADLFSKSMP